MDEKDIKYPHLEPVQQDKAEKTAIKLANIRAMKKLKTDSKWSLVQELMQEVIATYVIKDPNKVPSAAKLVEDLKIEIGLRYSEEPETKDLLLSSVPHFKSVKEWFKKEGWETAVWNQVKSTGLFTNEKRSSMIEALWQRGMSKSDNAAKIWLQLSGDLKESTENTEKSVSIYREINNILHKKNES